MKLLPNMMYLNRLRTVSLLLMLWIGNAYAEGGGGGGGIGGEGASGPEPQTWSFMIFAALILGAVSVYRARLSHRDVN